MKKILLISLVTVLAVSLVGCNGNSNDNEVINPNVNPGISDGVNNNENTNGNEEIENSGNDITNNDTINSENSGENITPDVPENNGDNTETNNPEDNEENLIPGEPENNEKEEENDDSGELEEEPVIVSELEGKINTLVQNSGVQVRMPMPMPIEAETALTYVGLNEAQFSANVKEAIAFESMIMPSNFSLCLIELNDSAKVADIKKTVIENCDLNKWICAWADKAMVVDSGKYIMLVMSTAEDCDALQKAFATEFGATGEVLTKENANI